MRVIFQTSHAVQVIATGPLCPTVSITDRMHTTVCIYVCTYICALQKILL